MKLSCVPVSYFPKLLRGGMSVEEWVRDAAGFGLDGIDLSILFFADRSAARLRAIRGEIEGAGLRAAVMNTYPDFTHPEAAVRERELRRFEEDLAVAAELGFEMVRVTAGQAHPGTDRTRGVRWAVEGLLESCPAAARFGVKLVFENHSKPGAWRHADFCFPPELFLEIADGVSDSAVRILFDTANPAAYGADPFPVLERVIDRIACVHVADTARQGALAPVPIGTGVVPLPEIFRRLRRFGYDGWLSIEEGSGTGAAGIAQAVSFTRSAWERAAGGAGTGE